MNKIDKFYREYAFLSNFYQSPMEINGIIYPTNEHFFQATKMTNLNDHNVIVSCSSPGQAKRIARSLPKRPDWEKVRDNFMLFGLRMKFQIPKLKEKLIETGDAELIEGNSWGDTYWGVCKGVGQNRLGGLLMQVRGELI